MLKEKEDGDENKDQLIVTYHPLVRYDLFLQSYIICYQTLLWGAKNPLKFASLPTCGFVAQLVAAPNRYLGGMGSSPVKA